MAAAAASNIMKNVATLVPVLQKVSIATTVLGVVGYLANESMYTVDAGHRAIVFDQIMGLRDDEVFAPGTHFIVPWLQRPIILDVRTTPFKTRTETGTKDLQNVDILLRILYRPDPTKLPKIYKDLGPDYATKVLHSLANEVLKAIVAQYDGVELITHREKISRHIMAKLIERSALFDIILDDVSVVHLSFSSEYMGAIEQKQVEQQNAERSKLEVEKFKQEKTAKIIRAEGEAEAARLIAQGMSSGNGYLTLRQIEAARDIAVALSRAKNVTYLPTSSAGSSSGAAGGNGTNLLLQVPPPR